MERDPKTLALMLVVLASSAGAVVALAALACMFFGVYP